jgi:hypothetical protein
MANATPLNPGQVNGAGDTRALYLKVFGGEVLNEFEKENVTLDKHTIRTITSGKSAQFPATGRIDAFYHTVGAEILGQAANQNERTILIDDMLIAPFFLADIDEAMSHFETRSEYAKKSGVALANKWDFNVQVTGLQAARSAATVTGGNGGSKLVGANYRTSSADLAAGLFASAQIFDEKNVGSSEEKFAFIRPAQYYLLAADKNQVNRDWDGAGSYSDGKVLRIAGIELVKTNQLPITNVVDGNAKYQGNFASTAGLVMTRGAVGTVKLLDLAVTSDWDARRLGTLVNAKYAIGHGILRPECAIELAIA